MLVRRRRSEPALAGGAPGADTDYREAAYRINVITADQKCIELLFNLAKRRAVLGDALELRVDAKIVRHPGRYTDSRGARMWQVVTELVGELAHVVS